MRAAFAFALLLILSSLTAVAAEPQKVILDTDGDTDYDDLVGLMAAAVSPELEIVGVVATGSDAERRARAIAKALDIVGRDDVEVYLGERPLSPEPPFSYMSQFPRRFYDLQPQLEEWAKDFPYHGPAKSGVDFYLDQIARMPGQVSIIVTGPLSTIGRAMEVADERGIGQSFRHALRQILFSGGDFQTVEYNIYIDTKAAGLVLHSGVPIYQFGGEGEGKAYLSYEDRQRLWRAHTPATWALQDLYRLWQAGWDPTSPFVPILYDAHPAAFLIAGPGISRFEPMALDLDADGRLVRTQGAPNANVRVENHGDRLTQLVVERLTAGVPPAVAHLRALQRIAGDGNQLSPDIDAILTRLASGQQPDPVTVAKLLDSLQAQLSPLGDRAERARWHLQMARAFLLGQPRDNPWEDPYTPRHIALTMPLHKIAFVLTKPKFAAILLFPFAALVIGVIAWRARRSHRLPARVG